MIIDLAEEEEGSMMRNSIRCCISCILPCGALDVIRIVHSNGRVEELSGSIKASDVMKAHPKHVLKRPSSPSAHDGGSVVPKIVVVPPDAVLQRGKIYFLMPLPSADHHHHGKGKKKKLRNKDHHHHSNAATSVANLLASNERYLTDILSENLSLSTLRERRRGRVAVWRPHLESISESPSHL
ncbi:hypothetical protein Fmac_008517 [Flemingia macrophylla]|uniref:Uncharacterized protein n=1 Tax=Flemingia macrophylla TaxID=520843 RepID=A0ABD1MYI0_9FABA